MEEGGQVGHYVGALSDPETWVSVAFVLFVLLFGRTLWRALAGFLDKQSAKIKAELDEAASLKREADAMLAQARAQRDRALAEATAMLEHAHAEAARLTEETRLQAAETMRRRERMAMDRIGAAERAAVAELRREAALAAARAAAAVIAETLTEARDAELVDRAIAGLPAALTRRAA